MKVKFIERWLGVVEGKHREFDVGVVVVLPDKVAKELIEDGIVKKQGKQSAIHRKN